MEKSFFYCFSNIYNVIYFNLNSYLHSHRVSDNHLQKIKLMNITFYNCLEVCFWTPLSSQQILVNFINFKTYLNEIKRYVLLQMCYKVIFYGILKIQKVFIIWECPMFFNHKKLRTTLSLNYLLNLCQLVSKYLIGFFWAKYGLRSIFKIRT